MMYPQKGCLGCAVAVSRSCIVNAMISYEFHLSGDLSCVSASLGTGKERLEMTFLIRKCFFVCFLYVSSGVYLKVREKKVTCFE